MFSKITALYTPTEYYVAGSGTFHSRSDLFDLNNNNSYRKKKARESSNTDRLPQMYVFRVKSIYL